MFGCSGSHQEAHQVPSSPHFNWSSRSDTTATGSQFAERIWFLPLRQREKLIYDQLRTGNLPPFLVEPFRIEFSVQIEDANYEVTLFVITDYLSIGSNEDHFLMPMTPILAQRVADQLGGVLPTRKMVDLIWAAAALKLEPEPIPPSDSMSTMVVFAQHNALVQSARQSKLATFPLGTLVAGHKKDLILSSRIDEQLNKVIIYGWHHTDGNFIQPVYSGHVNWYADYSHGVRLVHQDCLVNGSLTRVGDILKDPVLYQLLSDEATPMVKAAYDTSAVNYPAE